MGETIESERALPAVTAAAGSVQPGRFIGRASDRREGNKIPNWKTLSHSSPIPLFATPPSPTLPRPASHSLFLYSLTAFMEERRQTWTQP